jgi:anti-sigma factor RsiW
MTPLVTCKDFLNELNDYLDESLEAGVRRELEEHLSECPNCFVICDTTKRTIQIYRGTDPYPIPSEVHQRLLSALRTKLPVT